MAEPEGIGLLKPPDLIAINDVLGLVHKGPGSMSALSQKPGDAIDDLIRLRDTAAARSLDGMTLRSLILVQEKTPPTPPAAEHVR
jgi:hypothetical protein